MFDKTMKVIMLTFAIIFFIIGVLGIVDGIRSVLAGGYADNIVLGVIIACGFPIPCLAYYIFLKEIENNQRLRRYRGLR